MNISPSSPDAHIITSSPQVSHPALNVLQLYSCYHTHAYTVHTSSVEAQLNPDNPQA